MKLINFLKMIDPLDNIVIWTNESDENEPEYDGSILEVPYWLLLLNIGRVEEDADEPIRISLVDHTFLDGTTKKIPSYIVNVIV